MVLSSGPCCGTLGLGAAPVDWREAVVQGCNLLHVIIHVAAHCRLCVPIALFFWLLPFLVKEHSSDLLVGAPGASACAPSSSLLVCLLFLPRSMPQILACMHACVRVRACVCVCVCVCVYVYTCAHTHTCPCPGKCPGCVWLPGFQWPLVFFMFFLFA